MKHISYPCISVITLTSIHWVKQEKSSWGVVGQKEFRMAPRLETHRTARGLLYHPSWQAIMQENVSVMTLTLLGYQGELATRIQICLVSIRDQRHEVSPLTERELLYSLHCLEESSCSHMATEENHSDQLQH